MCDGFYASKRFPGCTGWFTLGPTPKAHGIRKTRMLAVNDDRIAGAVARLGSESAFEVLARARALEAQGKRVVHMEIGEPDFDTPAHIKEAGIGAIRGNRTHYTPAAGITELRDAIAAHVSRTRGMTVTRDQVVVGPGGKPVI